MVTNVERSIVLVICHVSHAKGGPQHPTFLGNFLKLTLRYAHIMV